MAQISNKTKNSVNGMKSKFSSPALNRFMGGETTTKKAGSTGENQKTKQVKSENKTATKIAPLEQGNNLVDMLLKIYTFLQKTHNEDKMNFEKMNQFREETKSEDDARQQRLLDAIKALTKPGKEEVTAEQEKESSNIIDSIFGNVGGVKTLLNLAKVVFMNPFALTILGVGSILALMALASKESHETASKVQNAMDSSAGGSNIMESASDLIEGRKNNLLKDRPANKKSLNVFRDPKLQEKYLQEIGFDPKTGLTAAEKAAGYTEIDANFNPVKRVESQSTTPSATPTTPDTTEQPSGSTPAPVSTPTSTPVQSNATPSPEPMASSPVSERLNQVQTENNTAKINDLTESSTTVTNNVTQSTAPNRTESLARTELPAVRNTEETFQKMIYYSTRVV